MKSLLIVCLLLFSMALAAQPGYAEEYDFLHIAKAGLTIPTSENLSPENAYIASSLQLAYAMEQLAVKYNQLFSGDNLSATLSDKKVESLVTGFNGSEARYRMEMRIYSPEMVGNRYNRMLIIRPDDAVKRPCILITHGSNVSFNSWATLLMLGIPDYLLRGYAVAVYEEWNSTQHIAQVENKVPAYTAWDNAVFGDLYAANTTGTENDDVALQRAYYMSLQYAHAAATYIVAHAGTFNFDPNLLFASGHSAGGLASLMLAFADSVKNFNHPQIRKTGGYNAFTYEDYKHENYIIRGVASSGAGLPDPGTRGIYTGNFIDPEEAGKVVVMLHGKNDPAAPLNAGPGLWVGPVDSLRLLGPLSLKKLFDQNGVINYTLINCIGDHGVYSYPLTAEDNSSRFKNLNPSTVNFSTLSNISMQEPTLHQLLLYGQQLWDMQWVTAGAFYNVINDSAFRIPSAVFSWRTGNYTNPASNTIDDWHFVPSSCGITHAAAEKITGDILASGFEYIPGNIQFSIFPTLATTSITISVKTPFSVKGRFHIWDMQGNLYYQSSETDLEEKALQIDVRAFPNGMYVTSFVNAQGKDICVRKFMIVK